MSKRDKRELKEEEYGKNSARGKQKSCFYFFGLLTFFFDCSDFDCTDSDFGDWY